MKEWIDLRLDDLRQVWYDIKRAKEHFCMWLSYYKPLKEVYDFDGDSAVLTVSRHQLKRVYKSLDFYRNHVHVERDLERIKLALKLLDIILEDDYLSFEDDRFVCKVKVNCRNAYRFSSFLDNALKTSDSALMPAALYREKAWYLYHRLMYLHLRSFWD